MDPEFWKWLQNEQNYNNKQGLSASGPSWFGGGMSPTDEGKFWGAVGNGDFKTAQAMLDANQATKNWLSSSYSHFQDTSGTSDKASAKNVATQMQQFATEMMKPPDPNDPMVRSIMNAGAANNAYGDQAAGIAGPAAANSATAGAQGAYANLALQRQTLGAQTLQGAGQLNLQGQEFAYQMAANKAAQAQASGRSVGSLIGGGIGAVAGAVGAAYTGNAGLVASGYQLGSSLGGGIGGATASGQNLPSPGQYGLGYGIGGGY